MKSGIHPEMKKAKVTCLGCKTTFETMATVDTINVEICSACHPFYTGKQKLVDTAGRVDRFRAQTAAAQERAATKSTKKPRVKTDNAAADLKEIKKELKEHTVDKPTKKATDDEE